MRLRRTSAGMRPADSADIAYLLLIFIIIMSIIGTDSISVSLPHSESRDKADRQSARLLVTDSVYIFAGTECHNRTELESAIRDLDRTDAVIIVADKHCQMMKIKSAISSLQTCGIDKVSFMTE